MESLVECKQLQSLLPPIDESSSFETSVKTFIIFLNIGVDIDTIFKKRVFKTTPYEFPLKKRGRKKKNIDMNPTPDLEEGSVIHVNYKDNFYGVVKNANNVQFFRNAMTIIMYIDGKLINFKLSQKANVQKSKLQMTGCKTDEQAKKCTYWFWTHLRPHTDCYSLEDDHFTAYYESVMRNIGFSLGFRIDRQALNDYINEHTDHVSIFETTLEYAGVNVKFMIKNMAEILDQLMIDKEEFLDDGIIKSTVPYRDLVKNMNIKRKKRNHITFLVFQSGKVIMSGRDIEMMRIPQKQFMEIINFVKEKIKEKIDFIV